MERPDESKAQELKDRSKLLAARRVLLEGGVLLGFVLCSSWLMLR
ncbi:MAG TPA: hypothetical protein VJ732_03975 [Bryobacteraceae bacterium]|nr:hypothetical protein [Bryobacteraceae bacterium]